MSRLKELELSWIPWRQIIGGHGGGVGGAVVGCHSCPVIIF